MALGLTIPGCQKRPDEIPGNGGAHRPAAHTNDVHVVVFDALLGGEVVVDQCRADSRNFVGADTRSYAAAANRHAAFHFPRHHGFRKRDNEIGIIVAGCPNVGTEIDDFVSVRTNSCDYLFLQTKPAVIGGDSNTHEASFLGGFRLSRRLVISEYERPVLANAAGRNRSIAVEQTVQ